MPLNSNKWKKKSPPAGYEVIEGVLEALENELRDKVKETNAKQRKTEALWPVHQINWQKSRYVYDMFYTHQRISRAVYQYCIDQKIIDAALIAKWKKPGYERLCSTYVINPANYKFGTTSICRVPWKDRSPEQRGVADPTTGCLGCASGSGQPRNIFGSKYGQNLAAVQIAREQRLAAKEKKAAEVAAAAAAAAQTEQQEAAKKAQKEKGDDDDDASTDDNQRRGEEQTDEYEVETAQQEAHGAASRLRPTNSVSASPGTSMPSHRLSVPISTEVGSSRFRSSSRVSVGAW